MARTSAGLLMYRVRAGVLEVLLIHPGGPFWASKDAGAWSIPKGEFAPPEEPLAAARREFEEETGFVAAGDFIPLAPVKMKSGKTIHAWAFAGDCDPAALRSGTFTLEWPPRSGTERQFPEADRAAWLTVPAALGKIVAVQRGFVEELQRRLG